MPNKSEVSERVKSKRALSIWNIEIFLSNFAFQSSGVFVNGFVISAYMIEVLGANPAFVGVMAALSISYNIGLPLTSILVQKLKRKKTFTTVFLFLGRAIYLGSLVYGFLASRNGIDPKTKWIVAFFCFIGSLFSSFTPAYNSWLSDLLPDGQRSQKLAIRNIIINTGAVCGVFAASFILKSFDTRIAFPILFSTALLIFISCFVILMNVYEPLSKEPIKMDNFSLFKEVFSNKNFLAFLVVVILSNFAVYTAMPFFTIFYLGYFKAPYDIVGFMTAGTTLMIVVGVFFWGKFMTITGPRLLSKITIIFLAVIPLLWFLVPENKYMLLMFLLAFSYSFIQGGWTISITSAGFSIADKSKGLIYISIYSAIAALCQVIAPIIAGSLAEIYEIYKPFSNIIKLPHPLMILFILSATIHIFCLLIFPKYKIQRDKSNLHLRHLLFRLDFALVFSRLANAAFMPYYMGDRKKLAENIGDTKTPTALHPLMTLLNDLNQDVRLTAIEAIGKIPSADSVEVLSNFYDGASIIERNSVIMALGNFIDKETEDFLLKIYASKKESMRYYAAYSLAKRKSERAKEIAIWKITTENYKEDDFLANLGVLAANRASEVLPIITTYYQNIKSDKHKEYALYYVAVIIGAKDDYYLSRNKEGESPIKKYIYKMSEALKENKEVKKSKNMIKEINKMHRELNSTADMEEPISFLQYRDLIMNILLSKKIKRDILEIIEFFIEKENLTIYEVEFVTLSIRSLLVKKLGLFTPIDVLRKVHDIIHDTKD